MDMQQMGINEWLLIAGTITGPILAVQAQKWIERTRENTNRKARIFESLMATRGAKTSPEHVRALNSIDLAFYGDGVGKASNKKVRNAWDEYRDHLNTSTSHLDEAGQSQWSAKSEELFVNLLVALSEACDFPLEKSKLRTGNYSPLAHFKIDRQAEQIRSTLVEVLSGERAISMKLSAFASDLHTANAGSPPNTAATQFTPPDATHPS